MLDESSIKTTYKRYAKNYDLLFGKIFEQGRRRVVEIMNCQPGELALDVGVGTGLALNFYPQHTRVVGIDLSCHMLEMAKKQVAKRCDDQVCLLNMDAQNLCFPDNTFDKVAAMYVASVVPHPKEMIDEIKRVCKPGGDIFILNHFSNHHFIPKIVETILIPLERVIGFRPRFPLEAFIEETRIQVIGTYPVNLFGYWTLLHVKNSGNGSGAKIEHRIGVAAPHAEVVEQREKRACH